MAASWCSTTRVDMAKQARFAMEFCAIESCGKCTPCRIGSTRGVETIDKIIDGDRVPREPRAARRPLQHHEIRLALRAGRLHALPGHERAEAFPGRFRPSPDAPAGRGMRRTIAMSLIQEIDFGTPTRRNIEQDGDADHRRPTCPGSVGHVDHAGRHRNGHDDPKALRHRFAGFFRFLPPLSCRDRGACRHARFVHHPGGRGDGRAHADLAAREAAQGCHGALYLGSSVGLPDLFGQW